MCGGGVNSVVMRVSFYKKSGKGCAGGTAGGGQVR